MGQSWPVALLKQSSRQTVWPRSMGWRWWSRAIRSMARLWWRWSLTHATTAAKQGKLPCHRTPRSVSSILTIHRYLMRGSTMPRAITIPDVDDATARWLVEEAERRGVSVETVAGQLLQRGLEWERRRAELPTYHDLDALAGTRSEAEAAAFLHAVTDFEHVDPALETWPRHPLHQCGNNRILSRGGALRPLWQKVADTVGAWFFPTDEARLTRHVFGVHNSLFISYLSLNNNFLQIPGAFFKPSGVKWRYAALPPAVRPMTLHPRFSNGRRLRLLVLVSPASAWSNS